MPRGTAGPLGRRLRGHRGQPVRVLHAGHRDAPGRARGGRPGPRWRRGATSRARCGPTCAAARGGSPSSRRPSWCTGPGGRVAAASATSPARPAIRCWPPGGPSSRDPPSSTRAPTWCWAAAGSPTTATPPEAAVQLGADAPLAAGPSGGPGRHRPGAGTQQHGAADHPGGRSLTATWSLTLQTTWVEPAYVEPDASWCRPGGLPASPLANGGAFGGKRHSPVPARARARADETGRPGPRPVAPRGRGASGPQAPPAGRGPAPGRHRRGACRPQPGVGRPGPGAGASARPVSRGRGGGGRGGRAAGLARAPWRGVGRGAGGAPWRWMRTARRARGASSRTLDGSEVTLPGAGRARVEVRAEDAGRGVTSTSRCGRARCSVR